MVKVKVWNENNVVEMDVEQKDVKKITENVIHFKNGTRQVLAENPKLVQEKVGLRKRRILLD